MTTGIKIGLEVHVQLNTKTKLFCGCKNSTSEEPNTLCCPTCTGMPGSKPSINREAITKALRFALATNCKINKTFFFSRKTYFYPDLPSGYQITQYELPIGEKGKFEGITLKRVHIEEDPGRLLHKPNFVLIDHNRSGTPLIEVVTEPEIKTPREARMFIQKIVVALEYLGVYSRTSDATIRCDANISLNNGERAEIKNINGAREVERALAYEAERQKEEKLTHQETRRWNAEQGLTTPMRKKETEADYGYITEPNLPLIQINHEQINEAKMSLPEMPAEKAARFIKKFKITEEDADVLTSNLTLANAFEKVAGKVDPSLAARWLRRDLVNALAEKKKAIEDSGIDENHLADLLELFAEKKINDKTAKTLLQKLAEAPFDVKNYVKKQGLGAVSDSKELEEACKKAITENSQSVDDYLKGNEKALNFIMGKVMKETKGRADPETTKAIVKKLINSQ